MQQSELKPRLSNKDNILPHIYTYIHNNCSPLQCVFLSLNYDEDNDSDQAGKELENSLITIYGSDKFKAFNEISVFIPSFEEQEKIHSNISAEYRVKAKDFICSLLQIANDENKDYIFSFLPKSI